MAGPASIAGPSSLSPSPASPPSAWRAPSMPDSLRRREGSPQRRRRLARPLAHLDQRRRFGDHQPTKRRSTTCNHAASAKRHHRLRRRNPRPPDSLSRRRRRDSRNGDHHRRCARRRRPSVPSSPPGEGASRLVYDSVGALSSASSFAPVTAAPSRRRRPIHAWCANPHLRRCQALTSCILTKPAGVTSWE